MAAFSRPVMLVFTAIYVTVLRKLPMIIGIKPVAEQFGRHGRVGFDDVF
jgi:hypothetical protein